MRYLKSSCQKALDILWVVGHTDWGADCIILLCQYCALVCSKLDHGCIVYRSTHWLILKQLDPIHHQGLHIELGAFHTSPAQSLYMEAHELSLASRHLKPSLNCVLKLKSLLENPTYSCVFEPENVKLFQEFVSKIPPLGIHILPHLEKSEINLNLIDNASFMDIAPWMLSVPTIRFDVIKLKKDTTNPETYKEFNLQLISKYPLSVKFSWMVLKQRQDSLWQLSPQDVPGNLWFVAFWMTAPYIHYRIMSYSFGSKTCVLF